MTTDVLIQVQDLKKHFTGTSAIKALDGVSVDIKKGEVVVVIGPSGSGKSTFLRTHEMGFAREVGSRVLFMADGKLVEQGTPEQIFEHPQNPRLQDFLGKVL